jgi:aspartyl-tRNA synthetase
MAGLRGARALAGVLGCGQVALDGAPAVVVAGWVQSARRGGSGGEWFVDLRDASGLVQLAVPASAAAALPASAFQAESVLLARGVAAPRPPGMRNPRLRSGALEIVVESLELLNAAAHPLAVPVEHALGAGPMTSSSSASSPAAPASSLSSAAAAAAAASCASPSMSSCAPKVSPASAPLQSAAGPTPSSRKEARLEHRYIDLRSAALQRNLRVRAAALLAARTHLSSSPGGGFIEVETPVLFKSTPEGAREFLVPTRQRPAGTCYALVQSPQQYKQLLMAGGVGRYFQLAKCFRDEGGRADRQPEFTQLDLEMSFAHEAHVMHATEGALGAMWQAGYRAAVDFGRAHSPPPAAGAGAEEAWEAAFVPAPLRFGARFFRDLEERRARDPGASPEPLLPTMRYEDAMERFGVDKPDLRFALEISDVAQAALFPGPASCSTVLARSLLVPQAAWPSPSRKACESLAAAAAAAGDGVAAVGVVRVGSDGRWERLILAPLPTQRPDSPHAAPSGGGGLAGDHCGAARAALLALDDSRKQALVAVTGARPGDSVLIAVVAGSAHAGRPAQGGAARRAARDRACAALGKARLQLAVPRSDAAPLEMLWVTDFPLFESEEQLLGSADSAAKSIRSTHHPFTAPHPDDEGVVERFRHGASDAELAALLDVRGLHYDLVCNGSELGGGSVRIHRAALQRHVLEQALGLPRARVDACFAHLLNALGSGCPPHAGLAIGVDRLLSTMLATSSLMDVIAFPKSQAGNELMTKAPSVVDPAVLREYHLRTLDEHPASPYF